MTTICAPRGRTLRTALATTVLALLAQSWRADAQFEITSGTGSTAQNFDGLLAEGTGITWTNDSTLDGWSLFISNLNPAPTYIASAGGGTGAFTGSFYSFGENSVAERALGGAGSGGAYFGGPATGTVAGYIAFSATNSTAFNLNSFSIGYDGEQWRNGGNTSPQTMVLEYGFGATFADVTSWSAPGGNFAWTSPVIGSTAGAVDGNVTGLQSARGGTINGLTWTGGQTLWVRWVEVNDAGNDHGLAIDNFSFSWQTGPPPKSLLWSPSSGVWDTAATNWRDTSNNNVVAFSSGDSVAFDDTGLGNNTVTVPAGGVSPGAISVNSTGTYTFAGGAINALSPLQKDGPGTVVLSASYGSGLNVLAGTVRTAASQVLGDGSALTLANGTTLDLAANSETVGALNLTGATITTGAGVLTIGGAVTLSLSPTDTPTTISGNLSTGGATRKFVVADSLAPEDLILSANLTGAGRVDFDGIGTVRIAGDNSGHTGGLQFDSGLTYVLASTKPLGTGQLFLNGGTIEATVALTGTDKVPTAVSLGGNGVTFAGQNIDFGGVLSFFGATAKTYTVPVGQTVTFSGTLDSLAGMASPPNSAITKMGPGILAISADGSAYTGAVTIGGGTLVAASANALGTGAVTIDTFAPDSATLAAVVSTSIGSLFSGFGDGTKNIVLGQTTPSVDPVVLTINNLAGESGVFDGTIEEAPGRVGALTKAGLGTQTLNRTNTYSGATTVNAGTLEFAASQKLSTLTIAADATARLTEHNPPGASGVTALDISTLSITGTGALDLTNNALVVRNGNLATVTALIKSGLYDGPGPAWDGPGIHSSTAAADPNARTAVGVISNATGNYATFAGVTALTSADILVKTTYNGDSDLNGVVNAVDYSLIDTGFGGGLSGWGNGDYDYNGFVNAVDYSLIDAAFGGQTGPLAAEAPVTSVAAVPEPSTIALLCAGLLGALGRRRRPTAC